MKKLLAGLLMVPCMAHANFINGNELWKYLNDTDYFSKGHSLGYITGVFDAYRGTHHCPPANGGGITAGQVQDIVKQYLAANPQIRNIGADLLIMMALAQTWPCQNKKGTKS